jgi:[glutamine synthetase] adenylyltransferase / [glutamine synthetase]-adenylyl-L-tyrosine phosphorylase
VNDLRGLLLSSPQREKIDRLIKTSPSPALARSNLQRLIEAGGINALKRISEQHLPILLRLLGGSAYLSEILIRQGKDWPKLFLRQIQITQKSVAQQLADLKPLVKSAPSLGEFCAALRQHKQREYLRIGARDLMPSVTLEETVRELSALGDASLDAACRFCRAEVEKDYGLLNLPGSDKPNRFVILGMGKLGGGELNFSSDIDVIFLYESDDGESISWEKTSDPTHSHANHH